MSRAAGRRSEKRDATPLTFLTVFCKAGEDRLGRETKTGEGGRSQRTHGGCIFGESKTFMNLKIDKKQKHSGFTSVLLSAVSRSTTGGGPKREKTKRGGSTES